MKARSRGKDKTGKKGARDKGYGGLGSRLSRLVSICGRSAADKTLDNPEAMARPSTRILTIFSRGFVARPQARVEAVRYPRDWWTRRAGRGRDGGRDGGRDRGPALITGARPVPEPEAAVSRRDPPTLSLASACPHAQSCERLQAAAVGPGH